MMKCIPKVNWCLFSDVYEKQNKQMFKNIFFYVTRRSLEHDWYDTDAIFVVNTSRTVHALLLRTNRLVEFLHTDGAIYIIRIVYYITIRRTVILPR